MPKKTITIGYYPLRGKAQVCRLLCEYLHINYQDKLYSYQQWNTIRKQKNKKAEIKEIPYLQEGKFRVTNSIPMCLYVIDRFGQQSLLGTNLHDEGIVDNYIWTIESMSMIININCNQKSQEEMRLFKDNQWENVVAPRLQKYEDFAMEDNFFLGYLTLIDFSIYQLLNYMNMIFGDKLENKLPKLTGIAAKVANIPEIYAYEHSQRCIKEMCPTSLLKQIKSTTAMEASPGKA